MALKTLQPGLQPLSFDILDGDMSSIKGGEVVTLSSTLTTSGDLAAKDALDGYINSSPTVKRPLVTKTLASGARPLFLADDGLAGYGTMFGSVVGGTAGQIASGTVLGPSTLTGSGKLTCWDKPGMYAVSLDACDTNATTGLQPTNSTLAAGAKLYATSAGLLTPNTSAKFEDVAVGRFVEFTTLGSLVNTPNNLVSGLASTYTYAVFTFGVGNS